MIQPIYHDNTVQIPLDFPFSLEHIFTCGQCFRWQESPRGGYVGVTLGRPTRIWTHQGSLFLRSSAQDFEEVWRNYFDLDRDYQAMTQDFLVNPFMEKAVAYGEGLRILRQDSWETLISFLISQCNRIPRIQAILDRLCRAFGDPVELEGETLYTFPSPQTLAGLTLEELAFLRAGYRAPYLLSAVQAITEGRFSLEQVSLLPTPQARIALMELPGVGRKVADCILLFGLGRLEAFPVDTWMKKAGSFYPQPEEFGPYAGVAQQYIFHYARSTGLSPH